jgi:hypothetical protein
MKHHTIITTAAALLLALPASASAGELLDSQVNCEEGAIRVTAEFMWFTDAEKPINAEVLVNGEPVREDVIDFEGSRYQYDARLAVDSNDSRRVEARFDWPGGEGVVVGWANDCLFEHDGPPNLTPGPQPATGEPFQREEADGDGERATADPDVPEPGDERPLVVRRRGAEDVRVYVDGERADRERGRWALRLPEEGRARVVVTYSRDGERRRKVRRISGARTSRVNVRL